ncbi:hypothetical protein W909_19725 [Dickeya zeae EC1]|nr:hypothetical protein W909_19725 [Dickeya zeae EC1]
MGLAPSGPLPAAFKSAYANLSLTPVTYLCKLIGIHSLAAFLQLELFWVYASKQPPPHEVVV